MQMLRRSKSPSKAASSSASSWSATGSSAVSSSAVAGPSSYSSSSSRPASPSKPPPSSWRPPSVAGSQAASGIHFDDEVYVDGEGSVAAEARLPGRAAADGVTRADLFDVVLDDEEQGGQLGDGEQRRAAGVNGADTRAPAALLPWLGSLVTDQAGPSSQTLDDDDDMDNDVGMPRTGSSGSINAIQQRSKTTTSSGSASQGNPARYESMLMELVETERSYVRRLDTLYNRYAKPLRQAARGREGVILPLYEAQRLFGNVGELLGANMAFLQDLEECLREGGWEALKGSVGDIAHRNVRRLPLNAVAASRARHADSSFPPPRSPASPATTSTSPTSKRPSTSSKPKLAPIASSASSATPSSTPALRRWATYRSES